MNRASKVAARLAPILLVSVGLAFAGAAQAQPAPATMTVIPEAAAQTIVNFLSEKFDFRPTDVTCPSGVEMTVGQQFQCQFTGPEGPYTAYMRITKVNGQSAEFNIATRRN